MGDGKDGCEMNTPKHSQDGAGQAGWLISCMRQVTVELGSHPASATDPRTLSSLEGGDGEEEGRMEEQTEEQMDSRK